ncbi:site-2 protease family protein [Sphingomonas cannabina]|uniref:site-2 protease family protein n=1 Tax=Sphingomonas cannabina TaxID=2899123 RepID=UPI001F4699F4|nr:site-2 protease family protein [Sphingomonas cannabina]UIJ45799.1 site-2 protease family protein [Sphingomonas cannabina]
MAEQNMAYTVAVWLIPLVFAIVCHEVAHGWVARALGDQTAANLGRLTLNPIKHVDPIGTVVLPLLLAIAHAPIFGWAKPVPVRAKRLRNPRRDMVLVALAGPGSNLVLALLTTLALGATYAVAGELPETGAAGFLTDNLVNFLLINVFLAIFNLIPLPPFDGGHVVEGALPRALVPGWRKIARFGFPLLVFLLLVLPMIAPKANIVARVIGPIAETVIRAFLALGGIPA